MFMKHILGSADQALEIKQQSLCPHGTYILVQEADNT